MQTYRSLVHRIAASWVSNSLPSSSTRTIFVRQFDANLCLSKIFIHQQRMNFFSGKNSGPKKFDSFRSRFSFGPPDPILTEIFRDTVSSEKRIDGQTQTLICIFFRFRKLFRKISTKARTGKSVLKTENI